jgi:threonyl-tRNA synthetase
VVIQISQDQAEYAHDVTKQLLTAGIRVENWNEAESMQKRIRRAEKEKVPYMLVVGNKEAAEKVVSVRKHGNQDLGTMTVEELITQLQKEIKEKSI